MQNRPDLSTSLGLLVLRVGVGGYLATHGWGKVQMIREGQFEMMGDPIGLGPHLSLWLVAFAEFACALAVVAGFLTRLAAIPPVVAMAVAAFQAHAADPWTLAGAFELFQSGATKFPASKEPALLFLVGFLALFFAGPGRFSVDGILRERRSQSEPAR